MDVQDTLIGSDWHEILELVELLKPLAKASKTAQKTATTSSDGALHTVLTKMERVLQHLEDQKDRQTHLLSSHFKACVNLG